mmetsp:Transcript_9631/g.9280  ORF Transcript_9631/g.9280 Transcript_9631/m.9280 type:complete len:225 (+) Transcript_9631:596-1270(+)
MVNPSSRIATHLASKPASPPQALSLRNSSITLNRTSRTSRSRCVSCLFSSSAASLCATSSVRVFFNSSTYAFFRRRVFLACSRFRSRFWRALSSGVKLARRARAALAAAGSLDAANAAACSASRLPGSVSSHMPAVHAATQLLEVSAAICAELVSTVFFISTVAAGSRLGWLVLLALRIKLLTAAWATPLNCSSGGWGLCVGCCFVCWGICLGGTACKFVGGGG